MKLPTRGQKVDDLDTTNFRDAVCAFGVKTRRFRIENNLADVVLLGVHNDTIYRGARNGSTQMYLDVENLLQDIRDLGAGGVQALICVDDIIRASAFLRIRHLLS